MKNITANCLARATNCDSPIVIKIIKLRLDKMAKTIATKRTIPLK